MDKRYKRRNPRFNRIVSYVKCHPELDFDDIAKQLYLDVELIKSTCWDAGIRMRRMESLSQGELSDIIDFILVNGATKSIRDYGVRFLLSSYSINRLIKAHKLKVKVFRRPIKQYAETEMFNYKACKNWLTGWG